MKTFNQFTNESLRDEMKGKSIQDIKNSISELPIEKQIQKVKRYKLDNSFLPSNEEIINYLKDKSYLKRFLFFKENDFLNNIDELKYLIPSKEELIEKIKNDKNTQEKIELIYELGLENQFMSTINVIDGDLRWMGDGGDWEADKKLILNDGITINGNLTVYHYFKDDKLPDNMTINGSLSLGMTNIIKMPKNLTVTGNIIAMDLDLYTLQNVNLGGKLYLEVTDEDNKLKDKIVLLYSNDSISFMDELDELGVWV